MFFIIRVTYDVYNFPFKKNKLYYKLNSYSNRLNLYSK